MKQKKTEKKNNHKIKYKLRAKIIKNKMFRENARTHVQRRCSLQIMSY